MRSCLLLVLLLAGCREFGLQHLTLGPPSGLDVQPKRVGAGGTLHISFVPGQGRDFAVTVNDRAATFESEDSQRQRFAYQVVGDEGETLNVALSFRDASGPGTLTVQANLDLLAPLRPDVEKLLLEQRPPGSSDLLGGKPGFVTGSDLASVEVAFDPLGQLVVARGVPAADGSLALLSLGDNLASRLFVFALDTVGNRSPYLAVSLDVEGPQILGLELSPRLPRSQGPLSVAVWFDKELAAAPSASFVAGGAEVPLALTRQPDATWRGSLDLLLPEGPATLRVEATDKAANVRRSERVIEVGPRVVLDPTAFTLRRDSPGAKAWTLEGGVGAAPAGLLVTASTPGTPPEVWGSRTAGAKGEFGRLAISRDLLASDVVELVATDDVGARLAVLALVPDVRAPLVVRSTVSPASIGPSQPLEVTLEADEALGPETNVRVGGRSGTLVSGLGTLTATMRFVPTATDVSGAQEVVLLAVDAANNVTNVPKGTVGIDVSGPVVVVKNAATGAVWTLPDDPPNAMDPPASVNLLVTDGAGLSSATWQLRTVRTGRAWDGTKWAPAASVSPSPLVNGAATVPVGSEVSNTGPMGPLFADRMVLEVLAEDLLGNRTVYRTSFLEYWADHGRRFHGLYPGESGLSEFGYLKALALVGERGLCAAGYTMEDAGGWFDEDGGKLQFVWSPDGGETLSRTVTDVPITYGNGYRPEPYSIVFDARGEHGVAVGSDGLLVRLDGHCAPVERVSTPAITGWISNAAWDASRLWLASDQGVFYSDDYGHTLTRVTGLPAASYSGVTVAGPGRVLAVGSAGTLVETLDGGQAWLVRSDPFKTNSEVWNIVRAADGSFWAGGDGVLQRSADGEHWAKPPNLPTWLGASWQVMKIRAGVGGPYFRIDYVPAGKSYPEVAWIRPDAAGTGWWQVYDGASFPSDSDYYIPMDDLAAVDRYTVYGAGATMDSFSANAALFVSNCGGEW